MKHNQTFLALSEDERQELTAMPEVAAEDDEPIVLSYKGEEMKLTGVAAEAVGYVLTALAEGRSVLCKRLRDHITLDLAEQVIDTRRSVISERVEEGHISAKVNGSTIYVSLIDLLRDAGVRKAEGAALFKEMHENAEEETLEKAIEIFGLAE